MNDGAPHGSAPHAGESRHRYPPRAVFSECACAALGLLFALGPFAVAPPLAPVAGVLAALAALFAAFGGRALLRHRTCLRLSARGLTVDGPLPRHLPWARLTRCSLGYYSTRRDRQGGWMQLKLEAQARRLRVDSRIEGFETIVRRAADAARARGLAFDPATVENLRALGIPGAAPDAG